MAAKPLTTITVIGQDKTGVVARVTEFLFRRRANIEALEEQVTRGRFSMTVLASWPEATWKPKAVASELKQLARALNMEIRLRLHPPSGRRRMAIMATREPKCLETILAQCASGALKAEPAIVIANRPDLKPLAEAAGVPFKLVPWTQRHKAEERALKAVDQSDADFIVLARFMKILSPNFVWRHKNKIINIHPSLLPSFPGPQAYRQAYEHGVKIAGVTAHFVSMHLDEGPIIAQSSFPVTPGMSLKEIVQTGQAHEAKALIKAIKLFLANKLDVHWGTVKQV